MVRGGNAVARLVRALVACTLVVFGLGSVASTASSASASARGFDGTTITVAGYGIKSQLPTAEAGAAARFKRFNDTNELKGVKINFTEFTDDGQDNANAAVDRAAPRHPDRCVRHRAEHVGQQQRHVPRAAARAVVRGWLRRHVLQHHAVDEAVDVLARWLHHPVGAVVHRRLLQEPLQPRLEEDGQEAPDVGADRQRQRDRSERHAHLRHRGEGRRVRRRRDARHAPAGGERLHAVRAAAPDRRQRQGSRRDQLQRAGAVPRAASSCCRRTATRAPSSPACTPTSW